MVPFFYLLIVIYGFLPFDSSASSNDQKWPTTDTASAVSQEWRLEFTQRAHSTVSLGDRRVLAETAKRVLVFV
jgi:hypothetical protein